MVMGKLFNLFLQKFMSSAKKAQLINFRKANGAWVEFMLAPSKRKFKVKGSDTVYYLKGVSDINDDTNQRTWFFLYGISSPIKFHSEHPSLIEVEKNKGNMQMQLVEADQQGYERAMLIKGNKDQNWMLILIIVVLANLAVTAIFGILIAQKLGITFM